MAIRIYWGPPGSYKTSSALAEFVVPALREGRVVVTNVRGLSPERCAAAGLTGEIIFVASDTQEGRDKWARYYEWLPVGCGVVLDEAHAIWPRSWTAREVAKLTYAGGVDKAQEDNRPASWLEGLHLQRHWNWDFVLTCQDIKQLRREVRETAEVAYKHVDLETVLGRLGKGSFRQSRHMAADSGRPSTIISSVDKKIDKKVFELYDSTATGEQLEKLDSWGFYQSKRFLFFVGLAVLLLGSSGIFTPGGFVHDLIFGSEEASVSAAPVDAGKAGTAHTGVPSPDVGTSPGSASGVGVAPAPGPPGGSGDVRPKPGGSVSGGGGLSAIFGDPLPRIEVSGELSHAALFTVAGRGSLTSSRLRSMGVRVYRDSACRYRLRMGRDEISVYCNLFLSPEPEPAKGEQAKT